MVLHYHGTSKNLRKQGKNDFDMLFVYTKYDLTETNFSKNIRKSIKFTDALYDIENFVEVSYMLFNI